MSSAKRAPGLEIRSGSELKLNVPQPLASKPHPDRHQNRPRNARNDLVEAEHPAVRWEHLPITANSATARIGRRREVQELGDQTPSNGGKWVGGKHRARGICRCCSLSSWRSTDDRPSTFLRSDR